MKKNTQGILVIAGVLAVLLLIVLMRDQSRTTETGETTTPDSDSVVQTTDTVLKEEEAVKLVEEPSDVRDEEPGSSEVASASPGKMRYTQYYGHPLDGPLYLSGTFGELRGNHFHAGLDIRTGGVEGKQIRSVADGYVSRIKVSTGGYGKALYIQHPNGTTSVYGHLQKFSGSIQDAVIKKQYGMKKYEFDWYVPAGKLKVTKGQIVALSGNTGGSGGPHLHFEIRDKRGRTVNPLLYGIQVKDEINPFVKSCRLYHLEAKRYEDYGIYGSKRVKENSTTEVKPGSYGVGVSWVDYFSDKLNRLGINYAELKVNGSTVFTQRIEDFTFDQGRYINMHIDYWRYSETGIRYVKMFKDRGNALHFYKGNGSIQVKPGETYSIELVATDFSGKTDKFGFTIKGSEQATALAEGGLQMAGNTKCTPGRDNHLGTTNSKITIPKGALYRTTYFSASETPSTGKAVSPMIRVKHSNAPLHKSARVSIKIPDEVKNRKSQLVMMKYNPKTRNSSYEGGTVSGSYITETTKSLGMFFLTLDTVGPKVTPLKLGKYLSFRVDDLTSEIGSYSCYVDGKWVLLEHEPKSKKIFGILPASYKTGSHDLVLKVKDNAGNETQIKKTLNL
ncbi:MAG: M23 family metallopeptidase [Bacteroidia bacterium]|nr:M23 family metallopeptidase [Bacteroidia bacterium]